MMGFMFLLHKDKDFSVSQLFWEICPWWQIEQNSIQEKRERALCGALHICSSAFTLICVFWHFTNADVQAWELSAKMQISAAVKLRKEKKLPMGKRIGGYKKQQKEKKKDYQVTVFKCILLAEFYMNRIKVEQMSCMSSAVSLCLCLSLFDCIDLSSSGFKFYQKVTDFDFNSWSLSGTCWENYFFFHLSTIWLIHLQQIS